MKYFAGKTFSTVVLWVSSAIFAATSQAEGDSRVNGTTPAERMAALRGYCASIPIGSLREARAALIPLAAKIYSGQEVGSSLKAWGQVAAKVYADSKARLEKDPKDNNARNPFEKHALIHAYMVCRDRAEIPASIVDEMKRYVGLYKHRAWFGYGALNYRVMNDGAGFIAAELWPDLKDSDGLDSAGIKAATKTRLLGYFADIVRNNTDEYGSPTYLGIDFSAIKLLADYAVDPEVKNQAALTLDSMLLHVACAWNHGYYVATASRAKYWGSSITSPDAMDTTAAIGWLYFGALRSIDPAHTNPAGCFWFTVPKSYRPPEVFTDIANDRAAPFTHRGGLRDNIRFTIYHNPTYALASEWTLLKSPNQGHYKESRRNMFKWVSDRPVSTFVPLQDNPRRPYKLEEKVANAFGYGENPFGQSLQHENTLIGIASVPADYPYWKMYAPFTTEGAIVKRIEKSDWVFCHGGSVLFAFRYLQPAYWDKPRVKERCDILRSDSRNNGWVLETSPVAPYAGGGVDEELKRFADAVLAKTKLDSAAIDTPKPAFTYISLSGHRLAITYRPHNEAYARQHLIDGEPVNYAAYPLFGNPWVQQKMGGDLLTIRHGEKIVNYDFKRWTRSGGGL